MSDEIAQVVEQDVARPMLQAVEDIGETVPAHFEGIGERLEGAAAAHLDNEAGIVSSIRGINPAAAESEAAGAAESGASNLGAEAGSGRDPSLGGTGDGESGPGQVSEGTSACETGGTDPVDVVSGQMIAAVVDLELGGLLPLVLRRAYASRYRGGRLFGPGWSSTLDQRVQIDADGIHYAGDDAQILHYPTPIRPGQAVLPADGARWPLTWDRASDTIRIHDPERGWSRHFTTLGARRSGREEVRPLTALSDRNGHRITFVTDQDAIPTAVQHTGGYRIAVDSGYTAAGFRIEGLRLLDGTDEGRGTQLVRYGYDPRGRLTEIFNSSGVPYLYEYDDEDRITAWTDRNGHRYEYAYDDAGRVVRGSGEHGAMSVVFAYDPAHRVTTVTDGLGHTTTYHYDRDNHVVRTVNPLGGTTLTAHDRFGRLLAHTDPLGNETRYIRADSGELTQLVRADGGTVIITRNDLGLPTAVTDPSGAAWHYSYDERGNLLSIIDPLGAVTGYTYDERGHLTATTDAYGNTETFTTDAAGLPLTFTDPLGNTTRAARDAFGRVISLEEPGGGVTTLGWTTEGLPAWRVPPQGGREQWAYDPEGNLLVHTDPAGHSTRFEYGPFDVVTSRTDPDGSRFEFAYDPQVRLTIVTNPLGECWTYVYDGCGGLVTETDFSGRTLTYRNDVSGRLIERVNATGQQTTLVYNQVGHLVEERDSDGRVTSYAHDHAGRLLRAQTSDTVLEYTRDPLGRVLTETVDGRVLTNEYDLLGRRVRRLTPTGAAAEWSYTALGRPATLTTVGGAISFQYDAAGRETTRFLGPSAALTQSWDTGHRLTGQAIWALDSPGAPDATAPVYRELQQRTYTYRADGYPVGIADKLRGTRSHDLDTLGRVTRVTAATGAEQYAYDALGNLVSASHPALADEDAGRREFAGAVLRRDARTAYEHDAQGRLIRKVRRTLSGQAHIWTYSWDSGDRLTQITTPEGTTWRYRYDALGRRIAKQRIAPSGETCQTIVYTWDSDRLAEQTESGPDGQTVVTTWEWDGDSHRPVSQLRRCWAADAPQHEVDRAFYAIVTDLVGTPLELVAPDGRIAWHPAATLWGEAIGAAGDTDYPLRFPGQYFDTESGLHYNYRRYYDPQTAGYLSADPIGLIPGPNPYAYVTNPLLWSDPLGLAGTACEVTVYHYTNKDGYNGIRSGNPYQIKPGDSKNGPGPFFTNLSPDDLTEPGAFKKKLGITNEKSQYVVELSVPKSQLVPLRGGRGGHIFSIPGGVSVPRSKVRYIGPTSGWSAG